MRLTGGGVPNVAPAKLGRAPARPPPVHCHASMRREGPPYLQELLKAATSGSASGPHMTPPSTPPHSHVGGHSYGRTASIDASRSMDFSSGMSSVASSVDEERDTYTPVGTADFLSLLLHHPCLQLILDRAAAGSKPGARAPGDTAKLGLVVEGGGMRGVVSGAMLMALDALGLRNSFDAVYGASAGAINLTYFLTGQREGLNIYSEDLTGSRFIDLAALWRGGPVMHLDYLIDHIMMHVKPLDWQTVLSSSLPLKVVASSLDSLGPVLLDRWSSQQDLVDCLKASAMVPQLAGEPRLCRGHRLVDAAIFEPVPLRTALKDGCSHVMVLCTRPATLHTTWRKVVKGTVVRIAKRTVLNAPYMRAAWRSSGDQLAAQDEELLQTLAAPPATTLHKLGGYVLPVYPHSVAGCNPITTAPHKLKQAEAEGWRAIATLFGCDQLLLDLGITPQATSPGATHTLTSRGGPPSSPMEQPMPPVEAGGSGPPAVHHQQQQGWRGLPQHLLQLAPVPVQWSRQQRQPR